MNLRISFDLDQTLITSNINWDIEHNLKGFRGGKYRLRKATVELFKWVREHNHEIWIYTNSYRGWKALDTTLNIDASNVEFGALH
jgi:phosphoserine phosphatase